MVCIMDYTAINELWIHTHTRHKQFPNAVVKVHASPSQHTAELIPVQKLTLLAVKYFAATYPRMCLIMCLLLARLELLGKAVLTKTGFEVREALRLNMICDPASNTLCQNSSDGVSMKIDMTGKLVSSGKMRYEVHTQLEIDMFFTHFTCKCKLHDCVMYLGLCFASCVHHSLCITT